MLPSSYFRRLRTNDLISKKFPSIFRDTTIRSSERSGDRVDFKVGTRFTHAYLPNIYRERTKTFQVSRVSGQINLVLEKLTEIEKAQQQKQDIYKQKVIAANYKRMRDTPIPPMTRQPSRLHRGHSKLEAIAEKSPKVQPKFDTVENLTQERMLVLIRNLLKDKGMVKHFRRNTNKIEMMPPVVCEGIPAWSQDFQTDVVCLVPVESLKYLKHNVTRRENGYIQLTLPKKNYKLKNDIYSLFRAEDDIHLSTSKLNKALVDVFVQGLRDVKFGENALKPSVNFDYLTDTVEIVYTKQLRVPIIPAIYLSNEEPLYIIRPNLPDLDPTSDILFRACFLPQEENILSKISVTDHGLRMDALRVIHRLCRQDWRLQAITVHQLKNVLMHDIDFEIDHTPRWQRLTRDRCVQSLLKRLLYFVKKRNLPHFFQSDFNLFKCIPSKYLTLMKTPLERLVSNEPQLLRDLARASRDYEEDDSSSESDEDWW